MLSKIIHPNEMIMRNLIQEAWCDEKGIKPRALYKKFGFSEDELTIEFGYPHQKFILHRK